MAESKYCINSINLQTQPAVLMVQAGGGTDVVGKEFLAQTWLLTINQVFELDTNSLKLVS